MSTVAKTQQIKAATVFDGEQLLHDKYLLLRDGIITQLLDAGDCRQTADTIVLDDGILAPGLIDLQVNGGGGVLFDSSPCVDTVRTMTAAHRAFGTTTMMPTLLSNTRDAQRAAVQAICQAREQGDNAVPGIHLEGPFFAAARSGAHRADLVRPPADEDIDWLCSLADMTVIVTLAPERMRSAQIRRLADAGVVVCAGHTEASYEQICHAATEGLSGITHLFNAMAPLHHRRPGTTGAALDNDHLWTGIIADGHHVHPAAIRLAWRAKPTGQLVLVSDAMATVGGRQDQFELYGETITLREGRLLNASGVLAGSAISLMDAVRYTHHIVDLPLTECLRMASLYPAQIIGAGSTLGRIKPGFRADLVHFDADFTVHNTWLAGQQQCHR